MQADTVGGEAILVKGGVAEPRYESEEKALCVLGNCCELKSESSLTRLLMSALT